ncbi:MAG: hypothetical protein IJ794_13320 [Lachnospiraceae bacterium]|nr:hypothetical protein [Lachnospiraceae bacterium]
MDYIQKKLCKDINRTKKRQSGRYSTIVGYYKVLMQYQLYLMFACIWDKREPELSGDERRNYLLTMKRASLGTILNIIVELDAKGERILGIGKEFQAQILEFIQPRNIEDAHGILIPGLQEESYKELAETYEKIHQNIISMNIPILSDECKIYYYPNENGFQATVFDCDDYDYQDLNEQVIKALDLQKGELYYYFGGVCYKISPFLILLETPNKEEQYEIYCYQRYDPRSGKFEYKRYSELAENVSCTKIWKDYFLSFQEESTHTICKANGVICNKFENNYDYFISTSPIDTYEQKVWQFIKKGRSNACLTIRGGGGIGKTALVQYVCNKNIFEPFSMGEIQYVIFCSAKDREFKQVSGLTGHIREIKNESIVRCYEDIIRTIGWVIAEDTEIRTENDIEVVEQKLIDASGVLLIIDDFETLAEEDKKKVVELSARLDVLRHKMIITTRSQYMVGEEYYLAGLDRSQTISFMKERFKKSCTEDQCKEFEKFSEDKSTKREIYNLTKGLPLLAIQLVNVFVLNGINEKSLAKREDEEVEDFLLGRLYSYFGTETSKILFLIIAYFFQYGSEEIVYSELEIMYSLLCKRLGVSHVDFEQDLRELQKLNIVLVETDFVRISNYISLQIIRNCQDELLSKEEVSTQVFDAALFKSIVDKGMRDGILAYMESRDEAFDYAFVYQFAFQNSLNFTNEIRFSIIEKFVLNDTSNVDSIRDIYREACKYFGEIETVESKFVIWSKKYGFVIPELMDKRGIDISEDETSTEYYLQEVITEFNEQLDAIDDLIETRRKGCSTSFYRDKMQNIRGKLGSICNVKLANILMRDLKEYKKSLLEVKDIMEEISITSELSMKDNEQYLKLDSILKEF